MNKKITTAIVIIAIIVLAILTGIFINRDSDISAKEFKMYFLTENGSSITAESK